MDFRSALPVFCSMRAVIRNCNSLGLLLCLLGMVGCSGTAVLNALTPGFGYVREAGFVFDVTTGLQLDVYVPNGARHAPVVVFFYGGSWQEGAREDYRLVGEALARQGLVAVVPDYRLYPAVRYPPFLKMLRRQWLGHTVISPVMEATLRQWFCWVTLPVHITRPCSL